MFCDQKLVLPATIVPSAQVATWNGSSSEKLGEDTNGVVTILLAALPNSTGLIREKASNQESTLNKGIPSKLSKLSLF